MKFDILNNFNKLFDIVSKEYPGIEWDQWQVCVYDLRDQENNPVLGYADFETKTILVHYNQRLTEILDVIAHECAHIIAGTEVEHGPEWRLIYESIFDAYIKTASSDPWATQISTEKH